MAFSALVLHPSKPVFSKNRDLDTVMAGQWCTAPQHITLNLGRCTKNDCCTYHFVCVLGHLSKIAKMIQKTEKEMSANTTIFLFLLLNSQFLSIIIYITFALYFLLNNILIPWIRVVLAMSAEIEISETPYFFLKMWTVKLGAFRSSQIIFNNFVLLFFPRDKT